ncbi:hypothetical protein M9Y10_027734 [Tritrichomonas musculus]|uniref:Uncharacterized protein n=1 Tax=Tritrichomonas musculus TaxID=1915356 RepID=A0ABR2H4X3_9EUKA
MLSNYKADKIKFVEEEEEIETSQTHDDSLKHFDCLDFLKLTDDLAIIAYIFDHIKPTDIDANYVIPIMSKLLESANDQNIIHSSILQFTSTHLINRLINLSDLFQQYLISMDISKLLINVLIQIIKLSAKSVVDETFLQRIYKTDHIFEDSFWILCLYIRKYEKKNISNILYTTNIVQTVDIVLKNYESRNLSISIIELAFKVVLSITTIVNVKTLHDKVLSLIDASVIFNQASREIFIFYILMIEEKFLIANDETFI